MTVANPASGRKIAVLPLAVTLAVHLVLVACWMTTAQRPSEEPARRLVSVLVRVPPLPPVRPAQPPQPAAPDPAQQRGARPSAPASGFRNDKPTVSPAPQTTLPDAGPLAVPASPPANDILWRAKQQAGTVDRALRAGQSGVPRQAGAPWGRFEGGVASAWVDRSRTTVADIYTGPDGEITYRFRQGDKVWCRKSGTVAPDMIGRSEGAILAGAGGAGSARTAGLVDCPSGVRHWESR